MDVEEVQNLRAADRFLGAQRLWAAEQIHVLGREGARIFLRRFSAEQTRFNTEPWEWIQLGIGLALLLVLIFGNRPPKLAIGICLLMLGVVLAERVGLVTEPDVEMGKVRATMEIVKLALGFGIAGLLLVRRTPDPAMFAREAEKEQAAALRRSAHQ